MGTSSANALAAALRDVKADIITGLRTGWGKWRLRPGWMLEHADHPSVYIEVSIDSVTLPGRDVRDAMQLSAADICDLFDACSAVGYALILDIDESELELE